MVGQNTKGIFLFQEKPNQRLNLDIVTESHKKNIIFLTKITNAWNFLTFFIYLPPNIITSQ